MNSRAQEVFFESEAALRLVDHEIDQLRDAAQADHHLADSIMEACERASGLVDALEAIEQLSSRNPGTASALRASLRTELNHLMGALQAREISSTKSSAT